MLIFASTRGYRELLSTGIEVLVKASTSDPYLSAVSKGVVDKHDDGWGYILVELSGEPRINYYRSVKPVFMDQEAVDKLIEYVRETSSPILGVVHSRKAGRREPVTIIDTHPFHAITSDGYDLWLAHNGGVDKENLARLAGIHGLTSRADSLVLTEFIASRGLDNFRESLGIAVANTLSALNLGIIVLEPGNARLVTTSYSYYTYSPENNKARYDYYKLYMYRTKDLVLYMSSTLVDYYGFLRGTVRQLPRNYLGEVVISGKVIEVTKGEITSSR